MCEQHMSAARPSKLKIKGDTDWTTCVTHATPLLKGNIHLEGLVINLNKCTGIFRTSQLLENCTENSMVIKLSN